MKLILLALTFGCTALSSTAQQLRTPAPSPGQTIKQDFGLSSIELSYSRPGVKGRKIFGDVRPFGVLWRTGANGPTTISFGDDIAVGGKLVKAGKYGLLSIPDKDNWIIIITKQLDVTSPDAYKMENDVVRLNVKPQTLKDPVETLTIQFSNLKPSTCDIQLMWENTLVSFPVTTDIDSKVMTQIDELMDRDNRPYYNAALYYLENGKDLNKALVWFNKAAEQEPKAFWALYQKARCLAKLGKKQDAIETANKSIEVATAEKNDEYVTLNKKLLATLK